MRAKQQLLNFNPPHYARGRWIIDETDKYTHEFIRTFNLPAIDTYGSAVRSCQRNNIQPNNVLWRLTGIRVEDLPNVPPGQAVGEWEFIRTKVGEEARTHYTNRITFSYALAQAFTLSYRERATYKPTGRKRKTRKKR